MGRQGKGEREGEERERGRREREEQMLSLLLQRNFIAEKKVALVFVLDVF